MTRRADVVRGREIIERWCALAEKRLEYLTELFETGRWRRFHTEIDFLENIQEAKTAVETWRTLARQEAGPDNIRIDYAWLDRPKAVTPRPSATLSGIGAAPPRPIVARPQEVRIEPERAAPAPLVAMASLPTEPAPSIEPEFEPHFASDFAESAAPQTALDEWQRTFDPGAIGERYPLLRNAL